MCGQPERGDPQVSSESEPSPTKSAKVGLGGGYVITTKALGELLVCDQKTLFLGLWTLFAAPQPPDFHPSAPNFILACRGIQRKTVIGKGSDGTFPKQL